MPKLIVKPIVWDEPTGSFFRGYIVDAQMRKKCVAEIDWHERGWRVSVKASWTTLTNWSKDLHTAKASAPSLILSALSLVLVDALEDPKPQAAG